MTPGLAAGCGGTRGVRRPARAATKTRARGIAIAAMLAGVAAIGLFAGPDAACAQQPRDIVRAPSAQRFALVIGNDTYRSVAPLRNARADARAIAQALSAAGFQVTLRTDLDQRGMLEAVRSFKSRLSPNVEAVFYFAGHGVQLGGANYLLPVDIAGDSEDQVRDDSLPLQRVLDDVAERRVRFSLAIIDACRNNPFSGTGRSLGGRGLAPTTAATGQMVLYSAGSGQTALDRVGAADRDPNGLFTRVLLREMRQPGLPVDRVLRRTRDEVVRIAKSVGHEQVPALYDQTVGDFYFLPPVGAGAARVEPPPTTVPVPEPMPAPSTARPDATVERDRIGAGAAPALPAGPAVFAGRFIGAGSGRLIEAELVQAGRNVTGTLEWAGNHYELQFEVAGTRGEGLIVDPVRNQHHAATVSYADGQVTFRVQTVDGGTQLIQVARSR